MSLRVLLIYGEGPNGRLHQASALFGAEGTIDVSVARYTYEIGNHPVPTLILLDLDLSTPPALEVLKWLRAEKKYGQIPVIALSSPHKVECVNRAYELGASACVMKTAEGGLMDDVARGIVSYARVLQSYTPVRAMHSAAAARVRF